MQSSAIDSLEASFQSIELTINRMCGLFGRPEGNTLDPVSSPPLAQDDEDGKAVRHHPLFPPEEDRLASLARRARSHAERLEGCCQELQEKYEQVAAIEQKLERSSVIWKVAVQKLTELLATQKAQLTLLKASHIKKSSASTSLSPPPSLSASVTTAATTTTKGSQKGARKLRRRDSDTLYERRNASSSTTLDIDDYENETDDSNLRNALEIMWKVERAKKEAHETAHQQALAPLNFDSIGVGSGNALIKSNNNGGGGGEDGSGSNNNSSGEDGSGGISGEDDIEQVSATILGNIVVLDEVMSEMAAYSAVSRKGKSKKRGGGETMIIDSGEIRKPAVMVDASVQTDPLAPEQLRSLLDSMVLTPNQDQGCNIQ